MAPNDTSQTLDNVLVQITTSNSIYSLNQNLRNGLPKEARDTILASVLGSGQDPLAVLDVRENTLGMLYILAARLSVPGASPPAWQIIEDFCHNFNPEHARIAPDRVTILAKGIKHYATTIGSPKLAIQPLYDLILRYPPDPSYLTTIHPIFILTCVSTRYFSEALPILRHPVTNVDTSLSDLHYTDNLTYHYAGGIALAALRRWSEAEECFEICVSSPATYPSALQLEALKKLKLVQLISKGYASNLPKYTHLLLTRMFKASPYNTLVSAYPDADRLRRVVKLNQRVFSVDQNMGLIRQAIEHAPRWTLKELTATYLTLGLEDIGKAVKIDSQDDLRNLLLNMIETNDISAKISADDTVTFSDPPPQFTKEQVDQVLKDVQNQTALLGELDLELGRSKEFLNKAVKNRDESGWAPSADEETFASMGAAGGWEESVFT